ncbi:uncharacterized protein JN550_006399 [Neoarthrinium moseri]|uniref:uncharacterized protein n=1 Tax=Neoarthrinium moseri TaxID=1658444 RepID=UPI001FDB2E27|nr:uncharacterized protein JN550_006399 [Neoarthrinium moseri]KAI1868483.1 hypothetical protein JN550_006399 [Neoarthrinium moseri]
MTRFGLEPLTAADWAKWRAFRTRHRSRPEWQLLDHVQAEIRRLERATPDLGLADLDPAVVGRYYGRGATDPLVVAARANVRRRWREDLRIWRPAFEALMRGVAKDVGGWYHEQSDVEEGLLQAGAFPKSAERVCRRARSRPDAMFRAEVMTAQAAFEAKLAEEERHEEGGMISGIRTQVGGVSDVGSWAYWKVRRQWEHRGIWYHAWHVLPGNAWAHELPVERWYASNGFRHPREMKRHRRATRSRGGVAKGTTARYRNAGKKRRGVRWADYLGNIGLRESDSSHGDEAQGLDVGVNPAWLSKAEDKEWQFDGLPARIQHRQENLTFRAVRDGTLQRGLFFGAPTPTLEERPSAAIRGEIVKDQVGGI